MKCAFYFVVDQNYALVAGLQARHLIEECGWDVHVFVEGASDVDLSRFAHPQLFIHQDMLSSFLPEALPSDEKWPSIVYLRVFAPFLLKEYERLVYLDADTCWIGSGQKIRFLQDLNFEGRPLAAVHDTGIVGPVAPGLEIPTTVWLGSIGVHERRYFNSGFMLINVAEWIKYDFAQELSAYFRRFGTFVRMWDQDFLNWLMQGSWVELSPRWNYQITLFNFGFDAFFDPVIVHFTDGRDPWHWQHFDWDTRYLNVYATLARRYGVDASEFPKPRYGASPRRALSRVKVYWRRFKIRYGWVSMKQKSALASWIKLRCEYIEFFSERVKSGRMVDINDRAFRYVDVTPIFNGRMMIDSRNPEIASSPTVLPIARIMQENSAI